MPEVAATPVTDLSEEKTPGVSLAPSNTPDVLMTASPSVIPSASVCPSVIPTASPSATPLVSPSVIPTSTPGATPGTTPTASPEVLYEKQITVRATDGAWITVDGLLPKTVTVTAVPVSVEIEAQIVLAAYDITILDDNGDVYEITEAVKVTITNVTALEEINADEIKVFHMEDEYAPAQEIGIAEVKNTKVTFEAESFSVYVLTAEDEENGEGERIPENLTDITSSISASLQTDRPNDGFDRSATLKFTVSYAIDDTKIDRAKAASYWSYDISGLLTGENAIFSGVFADPSKNPSGIIMDGDVQAGTYEIDLGNRVVKFYISESYLEGKSSGVQGTFNLYAALDAEKIGDATEKTVAVAGTNIALQFQAPSVSTTKTVEYGSGNTTISKKDGETIHYEVKIIPNIVPDTLVLTDNMGTLQTIKANAEGVKEVTVQGPDLFIKIPVTVDAGGKFTVDVVAAATAAGVALKAGSEYKVMYDAEITQSGYGQELNNTASWNWNSNATEPDTTTITVINDKELSNKTVSKETAEEINGNGDKVYKYTYTYTLAIGDETTNLHGYTITDTMTMNQIPVESEMIIYDKNGVEYDTVTPPLWTAGSANNSEAEYFTYTFEEATQGEGVYGPFTITYKTKNDNSLTGYHNVGNKLTLSGNNYTENEQVNAGNDDFGGTAPVTSPQIKKTYEEYDRDAGLVWWKVVVKLPDLEGELKYSDIIIREKDFTYKINGVSTKMTIDWEKLTVKNSADNSNVAFTLDEENNDIKITDSLDNISMVIMVPTVYESDDFGNVIFDNTAVLTCKDPSNNNNLVWLESHDWKEYVSEYPLKKEVLSTDAATGIIKWKVSVNNPRNTYDPDITFTFRDTIPAGLEYVNDSFYYEYWTKSGNYVKKTQAEITGFSVTGSVLTAPAETLSEREYSFIYETRIVSESLEVQTFTNRADLLDTNDDRIAGTSATATVKRDLLNKSAQGPVQDKITYTIDVNKSQLDLVDGDVVTLTDKLSDLVEMVIVPGGSVTFKDGEGNTITEGVSYSYVNKELTITIPDNKYVKIQYAVRVNELGNQNISNTVELKGKTELSSFTGAWYNVTDSSATITGRAGSVTFTKYDDTMVKTLPGAKITIYEVPYVDDGTLSEAIEFTTGTTGNDGKLVVEGLEAGNLYYWQETSAPFGYEISDTSKHYFAIYGEGANGSSITKNELNTKISSIKSKNAEITSIKIGENALSQLVTDTKLNELGSFTIRKTLYDAPELTPEQKEDMVFTVTGPRDFKKIFTYEDMLNGSITLEDLELGVYKVSEEAMLAGYNVITTYKVGEGAAGSEPANVEITTGNTMIVEVINTYELQVVPTPTATPTAVPTATPGATPAPTATPAVKPTATPAVKPTATPAVKPTATPDSSGDKTPAPTAVPTQEPTAEPIQEPTAIPTLVPTSTPLAEPTATPEGDNGVVIPGDDTGNDDDQDKDEGIDEPEEENQPGKPIVMKPVRIQEKGVKGAVRGARRGLEYAVLGRRRRPVTGDSLALLLWVLALSVAVGGSMTSGIMLAYEPVTPKRKRNNE